MKGKYLITTDAWFIAPDGNQYKAAWGEVEILEDKFLGINTNRNSSNWYAKVGTESNHIIIAGCQIHYAYKCEKRPLMYPVKGWPEKSSISDKFITPEEPTKIYVFEDKVLDEVYKPNTSNIIETSLGKFQKPHSNIPLPTESGCLHDQCPNCRGTGKKRDGTICLHNISCNCPKCTVR